MKRCTALIVAVAGLSVAGCGTSVNGNTARTEQAQREGLTTGALRARLNSALSLSTNGDFFVGGDQCSVVTIAVGSGARAYATDPWTLTSRNAAVKVSSYQGTPESVCLAAAKDALGW